MNDMLLEVRTDKELKEVAGDLLEAIPPHQFGVMATHDLRKTMESKGVEFSRECLIFEVCNPHQAKRVLEAHMEISTALPCRISVYREGARL